MDDQEKPTPAAITAMIINFALLAGLITFAVIVVFALAPPEPGDADSQPILTLMALGLGVSAIIGNFILAGRWKRRAVQALASGDLQSAEDSKVNSLENALVGRYMTGMILSNALLEGTGFIALTAYMVDGHWMALALVAVILTVMAAKFSTPGRVANWVAQVQKDARDLKGFSVSSQ